MKAVFSFIVNAILFFLGILMIVAVVSQTFEQSISVFEISPLETAFFVVFFFLIRRHIAASAEHEMPWSQALYLPLRNLGWFLLLILVLPFFSETQHERSIDIYEHDNIFQLIGFICVAFCIYIAAPAKSKNKHEDSGDDAPVEVKP